MKEITAKRLAIVRHLYEQGVSLSHNGEPTNGLSILPFHDSVEMFMKLCADVTDVRVERSTNFMDYFTKVTGLQCKVQMDSLNSRRISLKHYGQLPASLDVEVARVNVSEFYSLNVPAFFGCTLEEVSLEVLISYSEVKQYLAKYHDFITTDKYGDAQAQCQIAFKELIKAYHKQHNKGVDLQNFPAQNARWLKSPNLENKTDEYLEKVKKDIISINEAISIMNLGINYYKYSEFIAIGPVVNQWRMSENDEYDYFLFDINQYTKESAESCYVFVVDSALQLQNKNIFF